MSTPLDDLDRTLATAFEGYVVRKDLVRSFSRQYPVPTYVAEFLLGRYCATTDEDEIAEGLHIVARQLQSRSVRAGEVGRNTETHLPTGTSVSHVTGLQQPKYKWHTQSQVPKLAMRRWVVHLATAAIAQC